MSSAIIQYYLTMSEKTAPVCYQTGAVRISDHLSIFCGLTIIYWSLIIEIIMKCYTERAVVTANQIESIPNSV